MSSPVPDIHNRFDRIVKSLADEANHVIAHMVGVAALDAGVKFSPLRPETAPPVVFPDYVAVLVVESDDPFTFHVEFQLIYSDDVPPRMARYGGSLAWQDDRRVVSILVLPWRDASPEEVPDAGSPPV